MVLTRTPEPLSLPTALWVLPVADLGGVARHVLDVTGHGVPGWRLVVACPEGPLAGQLRARGVAVTTGALGPAAGTVAATQTVRRLLGALRPRVVHSHLAHADLVTAAAATGLPVVVVSTEHGIAAEDAVYHRSRLDADVMARLHKARLRRTQAVIAVSEATEDAIRDRWRPGRGLPVRVVRNGVDRPAERPTRRPGLRVLSLARLAPEKRIDALLDAMARLREDHPEATLTVAGEGPLRPSLTAQARRLGLGEAATFLGHADAGPLLSSADVVVQLSVWENCSYTLLDAMTHGCAVVATDVGGNPEMLPPSALVRSTDPVTVAAAMSRSGLDVATRPALPLGWPTIEDMCVGTAEVYAEVTR